ncbi:8-oxo-dGTP pyrophosphatase MutT (NUDIX family) [Streptococcus rupicaprae]|uniref:8-oxo-dGTP pyrophosphatase MutT (NUDIX family) n=1 Tax=Streptococcus rupicaprae TaxID=759619 RepID=A0ABV2FE99_9STRE
MPELKSIQSLLSTYQPKPINQKTSYAILLPLIKIGEAYHVLYQVRAQHISQPGEVAFPGGQVETGESLRAAAIRETVEELNIASDQIQVLGEIDFLVSGSRTIHCFVGEILIEDWQTISPNEEVERLFVLPLDQLMATPPTYYPLTSSLQASTKFPFERIPNGIHYPFKDFQRTIPFYDEFEENLWGMTALFTHRFVEMVRPAR